MMGAKTYVISSNGRTLQLVFIKLRLKKSTRGLKLPPNVQDKLRELFNCQLPGIRILRSSLYPML